MSDQNTSHFNLGRRYVADGRSPVTAELRAATTLELAWVAGLFEGEGSIVVDKDKRFNREYASPRLNLNSVDRDVIERLRSVMGGRINREAPHGLGRQEQWRWTLQGYQPVAFAVPLLMPWLGERRRRQVEVVMDHCDRVRAPFVSRP